MTGLFISIDDYVEPDPIELEVQRAIEIVQQNEHYDFYPSKMNSQSSFSHKF